MEALASSFPKEFMAHVSKPALLAAEEPMGMDNAFEAAELVLTFAQDKGLDMSVMVALHKKILDCPVIVTQRIICPTAPGDPVRIRYPTKYHYVDFVLG